MSVKTNKPHILGRRLGEAGSAVDTGLLILGSVTTNREPRTHCWVTALAEIRPWSATEDLTLASMKPELVGLQASSGSSTLRLCENFFSPLNPGQDLGAHEGELTFRAKVFKQATIDRRGDRTRLRFFTAIV